MTDQCCGGPRKVQAKGVAYAEVLQNLTLVRVNVGAEGQSSVEVQDTAAASTKAVLELLASKGERVLRVQNTGVSLSPQYGYDEKGNRVFQKYVGSSTVSFEVPEVFGDVLDAVQNMSGARIETVLKKESSEDLAAAQQKAMKTAVHNSQQNGEKMLEGIGETLGKALYVQSYTSDYLQSGGGSQQLVRAEATVTYEIVG